MDEKVAEARPVMGTIFLVIKLSLMNKSQELTVFHGRHRNCLPLRIKGQKSDW